MESKSTPGATRTGLLDNLLLVPAVIALGLIIATVWVWDYIRDDQASHQWEELNGAAVHFSALLDAHIATRLDISDSIRSQWAAGEITSETDFRGRSRAIRSIFYDFQAINWVDQDGVIRWVTPLKGNEPAVGLDVMSLPVPSKVLQESRRQGGQQVTPPISLAQGGQGFVGYSPLYRDDHFDGYLNIVFRTLPLIKGALREVVVDTIYLTIHDGGDLLYSAGGTPAKAGIFAEVPFSVGNRTWTVRVDATDALIAKNDSFVDELSVILGGLLAIVVSVLVYMLLARQRTLRLNEARLRNILDHSSTPIYFKDLHGRYRVVNRQFEKTYGVQQDNLLGKTALEVFGDETAEKVLADDIAAVSRNKASVEEATFFDKTYIVSKFPIRAADGDLIGVGGIEIDITERLEIENKLKSSQAEAIRANQAKSEFLAHMSHELRTPLNSILGFSETMASGFFGTIDNPRYIDYLDTIMASGHHLLSVINDILDLSKIEAGELEIFPEYLSVQEVIDDCLRLLAGRSVRQTIPIECQYQTGLPKLRADQRYLKQVILNLLSNAVKYSHDDSVVHIIANQDAKGRIAIAIQDTGIGIRKEDLARVMEPFGQARANSRNSHEGTGLGLSLSKHLIELHGGTLTLDSEFGVGTTVTIRFPPPKKRRNPLK